MEFKLALEPSQKSYNYGDTIQGSVEISSKDGQHQFRSVEFEFRSEFIPKNGKPVLLSPPITKTLIGSVTISPSATVPISPFTVPSIAETYHGGTFSVIHRIRIVLKKTFGSVDSSHEVLVFHVFPPVKLLEPKIVRVAVPDILKIEMLINRKTFDLDDMILVSNHFLMMNIRITMLNVALVAEESYKDGGKTKKKKYIVKEWEMTDGTPITGEIIPFRMFLDPIDTTPSVSNEAAGYSVNHFIHFLIKTSSGDRYFSSLPVVLQKWSEPIFKFKEEE